MRGIAVIPLLFAGGFGWSRARSGANRKRRPERGRKKSADAGSGAGEVAAAAVGDKTLRLSAVGVCGPKASARANEEYDPVTDRWGAPRAAVCRRRATETTIGVGRASTAKNLCLRGGFHIVCPSKAPADVVFRI